MLYAYCPNDTTTIVTAALNRADLEAWFNAVGDDLFAHKFETDFMQHLSDSEFIGFSSTVFVFTHTSAQQQKEFAEKHQLLVGSRARAIDRHTDMVNYDAPDPYDPSDERTIEQIYGLTTEDRFDKRSEEEKANDAAIKKMMDELRKKGEVSEDSFAPRKDQDDVDSDVHVTDIRSKQQQDGTIELDNILARKENDTSTVTPNATLTIEGLSVPLSAEVQWSNTTLKGSEILVKRVFEDNECGDYSKAVMQVVSHDGAQTSNVVFNPLITNIHASTPYVEATPPVEETPEAS